MRNIIDRGNWSEWGRQGNIYFPSLLSSPLSCIPPPPHQERQSRNAKREKVKSKKAENNGVWLSSNSLHNCCEIIFNFSFLGPQRHIIYVLLCIYFGVCGSEMEEKGGFFCVSFPHTHLSLLFHIFTSATSSKAQRNHPRITVALLRSRFQ